MPPPRKRFREGCRRRAQRRRHGEARLRSRFTRRGHEDKSAFATSLHRRQEKLGQADRCQDDRFEGPAQIVGRDGLDLVARDRIDIVRDDGVGKAEACDDLVVDIFRALTGKRCHLALTVIETGARSGIGERGVMTCDVMAFREQPGERTGISILGHVR